MIGVISKICILAAVGCLFLQSAQADVILSSITGSVSAKIDPAAAVTGSTTLQVGSVTRTFNGPDNNFTTSSETQNWNDISKSLTGSGLVTETKFLAARPGNTHHGLSTLTLVFTTTTNTSLALGGTWGFVNDSVTLPDSISWTLSGPSTFLSQSATAGGGNAQAFSQTTSLNVGTFTFTISANFNEKINNLNTRTANWNLSSFNLVSVPEDNPLALIGLGCGLFIVTIQIRRKRLCAQAAEFSSAR